MENCSTAWRFISATVRVWPTSSWSSRAMCRRSVSWDSTRRRDKSCSLSLDTWSSCSARFRSVMSWRQLTAPIIDPCDVPERDDIGQDRHASAVGPSNQQFPVPQRDCRAQDLRHGRLARAASAFHPRERAGTNRRSAGRPDARKARTPITPPQCGCKARRRRTDRRRRRPPGAEGVRGSCYRGFAGCPPRAAAPAHAAPRLGPCDQTCG